MSEEDSYTLNSVFQSLRNPYTNVNVVWATRLDYDKFTKALASNNTKEHPWWNKTNAKKTIAEYERTIRQLESRSGEIDKLRSLLAETEQSVKQKADEKETENQKLRNILKNYENSYGICVAKKEEEIKELQQEIEKLKNALNIKNEEKMNSSYVQTTFES